jgi:hypothetical protein
MKVSGFIGISCLMATALSFTACSSDSDAANELATEQTATINFTAELPSSISARAAENATVYSDGTKATTLYYAVYTTDNNSDRLVLTNYGKDGDNCFKNDVVTFNNLKATVSLNLAIGHTYKFAFWAQSPEAKCYSFNTTTGAIDIDYSSMLCNDENTDAFYSNATLTFGANTEDQSITLSRPFAQLNIGATDYNDAKSLGLEVVTSQVSIFGVCNSLNLLTDTPSGFASVNFDFNTIPAKQQNSGVFPAKENGKYVDAVYTAMNYILVANGKQNLDIQFNYKDAAGTALGITDVRYLHNIPLERNHRTNVYGELLLSQQSWTIEIDPTIITPDYNVVYTEN